MIVRCVRTSEGIGKYSHDDLKLGETYIVSYVALWQKELHLATFDHQSSHSYPFSLFEVVDGSLRGMSMRLNSELEDVAFIIAPAEFLETPNFFGDLIDWEPDAVALWARVKERFVALNAPEVPQESEGYVESRTYFIYALGRESGPTITVGERGKPGEEGHFEWSQLPEIIAALRSMSV